MSKTICAAVLAMMLAGLSTAWAAPPVEDYGKLPGIEDLAMSPSGDRYAFVALVDGVRRLMVLTTGGEMLANAAVGKVKVRGVWWAGEDHVVISYSATATLGMDFTVWRAELSDDAVLNLTTRSLIQVFAKARDIAHSVYGEFGTAQIGGHWYGYFGGVTFENDGRGGQRYHDGVQYSDLYRVDLDTGAALKVANGSMIGDGWLVGPDGAVVTRSTYDPRSGRWEVKSGAREGKLLASGHGDFGGASVWRGRTADSVLVQRPTAKSELDFTEISLLTGQPLTLPAMDDVRGIVSDRATGLWIGAYHGGDQPRMALFDPQANARVVGAYKAFPGLQTALISWNGDFSRIIAFTSGEGDPGAYWMVDVLKGKADPFGYPYPTVHEADVGPIRIVDWKAADGTEMHGVLSLPAGRPAKSLPVVVMPHGGPEARDYPEFDWWAQAFASQGYAVFQPNFRGSSGYGTAFRDAGFGQWGRKMQTDVSDGVDALAKQGLVDPHRVCIVGASYGGYAALAGVTLQHGVYRCAVAVAGIGDVGAMTQYVSQEAGQSSNGDTRYWRDFVGDHPEQISPIRFASGADAPILLVHGKDDTVVPIDQSLRMQAALKAAGKPVELVVMPGEDHWLSREETRVAMLKASVAFVEAHDPPDPAPPAAKP